MRKRVDVLAAKRAEAKAVFDQAVSERQSFLLEGDLSDERAGDRLQKAVDAAASRVTGFDGALLALQTQLDDVEMKLRAENEAVERERVASEVEATTKTSKRACSRGLRTPERSSQHLPRWIIFRLRHSSVASSLQSLLAKLSWLLPCICLTCDDMQRGIMPRDGQMSSCWFGLCREHRRKARLHR